MIIIIDEQSSISSAKFTYTQLINVHPQATVTDDKAAVGYYAGYGRRSLIEVYHDWCVPSR